MKSRATPACVSLLPSPALWQRWRGGADQETPTRDQGESVQSCQTFLNKGFTMTGETVLVVEDNRPNMELVTALLEASKCRVLQAWTAEEGIRLAGSHAPALILMDISLPGMDGLTATAALKRDPRTRDIPVVALTAHAMKGDEEKALSAGCAGYIAKPIDTRAFPKAIEVFLRGV
jgi:two-component system, cell cycle response regulator DivK